MSITDNEIKRTNQRYRKFSQMKEHPDNLLLCEQTRPVRNELSLLFYCKATEQVLLSKNQQRGIFFPTYRLHPEECVTKYVEKAITSILDNFTNIKSTFNKMIRLLKLPVMNSKQETIIVYTYLVYVERTDAAKCDAITETKTIERGPLLLDNSTETSFQCTYFWVERKSLSDHDNKLWGPEVYKQTEIATEFADKFDQIKLEIVHVCSESIDEFFRSTDLKNAKCFVQHTFSDQRMLCALWNEWIFHTVPSIGMSIYSFERFLGKLSIYSSSIKMEESFHHHCMNLYNAILSVGRLLLDTTINDACSDVEVIEHKITRTDYIQFMTLCVGLVLLDSNSPTFRFWEANMTFSFSYFSENSQKITYRKFREMAHETKLFLPKVLNMDDTQENSSSTKNQNWIKLFWRRFKPSTDPTIGEYLTLEHIKAFWDNSKKERYEEVLCILARSATFKNKQVNIIATLQSRFMTLRYDATSLVDELINGNNTPIIEYTISKADLPDREPCTECREQDFEMRLQRIKLDSGCQIENIKMLDNFECYEEEKAKIGEEIFNMQALFYSPIEQCVLEQMLIKSKPELIRSLEAVKELYERSPSKIATINGPVVVLGAVHGNYNAIRKVCSSLFPTFPHNVPIGIVTLGNYFDDSSVGFEAILCLLLAKLVQPAKIILVRGRNDTLSIFERSKCAQKIRDLLGEEAYTLFVEIIDYLPFAVIIDEKIFATSSGIPLNNQRLAGIVELNGPEKVTNIKRSAHQQILKGRPTGAKDDGEQPKQNGLAKSPIKSSLQSVLSVVSQHSPAKSHSSSKLVNFTRNDLDRFLTQNSLLYFIRNDSAMINEPFRIDDRVISLRSMLKKSAKTKFSSAYVVIDDRRLQIVSFEL